MATPIRAADVWQRMMRNLLNCHEQVGDFAALRVVQCMFECRANTPPEEAASALAYGGAAAPERTPHAGEGAASLHQLQQQQLMRMLQVLQLQQQQAS